MWCFGSLGVWLGSTSSCMAKISPPSDSQSMLETRGWGWLSSSSDIAISFVEHHSLTLSISVSSDHFSLPENCWVFIVLFGTLTVCSQLKHTTLSNMLQCVHNAIGFRTLFATYHDCSPLSLRLRLRSVTSNTQSSLRSTCLLRCPSSLGCMVSRSTLLM